MGKVKRITMFSTYGLLAITTITGIVGFVLNLYGTFWWYDLVQHGGFMFALTLTMMLHTYRGTQNNASRTFLLLITVVFGLSTGVLWEVLELAYDRIAMANTNSDFVDIFADLLADAVGVLAAGLVVSKILVSSYPAGEKVEA